LRDFDARPGVHTPACIINQRRDEEVECNDYYGVRLLSFINVPGSLITCSRNILPIAAIMFRTSVRSLYG